MLWVYEQDEGLAVRAQKMTVDGDCVHESDVDGRIFQEGAANCREGASDGHGRVGRLVGRAEFDEEDAADDEGDAERHDPGEGLFEQELAGHCGEGDAGGGPDAVGNTDAEPEGKDLGEEEERAEVAHDDGDVEQFPSAGCQAQGERRADFEDDREDEEEPDQQMLASLLRCAACDPSSTVRTPPMINARPRIITPVKGCPNRSAASTAVRATPIAPQIPYATPRAIPSRRTSARSVNAPT